MTDENGKNNGDESPIDLEMVLETAPTASESPSLDLGSSVGGLFGDDTILITAAKFALVEGFLRQIPRDQAFGDFLRELLLTVMKVVKSEAGSLLEVDHETNSLFFRSVVGTSSDRVAGFVIPMGQGIVGHVAESRRPVV